MKADVVVAGDARTLHPEVEATLLRITQETLSNVGKHADATRVGVTLTYDGDEVILDVRDDGVGFDPDRAGATDVVRAAWHAPACRPARRRPRRRDRHPVPGRRCVCGCPRWNGSAA